MRRFTVPLCLLLGILSGQAIGREWSMYSTENFTAYSDAKKRRVIQVLEDFEAFRKVVLAVTGQPDQPEPRRLVIMIYSRNDDYGYLQPNSQVAGHYLETGAGPRIIVGPAYRMGNSRVLFHEYVHHLMRSRSDVVLPRWYEEGFAEFLAATRIRGEKVTIGKKLEGRREDLGYLGKISVLDLLQRDPAGEPPMYAARFYATAWLFVHYLQMSPFKTHAPLQQQTADYLLRYDRGEDALEAFRAAYGMSPDEMDEKLFYYQDQKRSPELNLTIPASKAEVAHTTLSEQQRAFILADTAWRHDNEEAAIRYLREPESLTESPRALSLLAVLENHDGKLELARKLSEQALAQASENPDVLANVAHVELDYFERAKEDGITDEQALLRAAELSQKAARLDASLAEARYFSWRANLHQGHVVEAARSIMETYRLNPTSLDLNHTIGNFLLAQGEIRAARPFVARVYRWAHNSQAAERAKVLLGQIDAFLAGSGAAPVPVDFTEGKLID